MSALHAEWTKFRTLRGRIAALVGAALASVLFLLVGTTSGADHPQDPAPFPVGPGGEAVNDNAYFLHRELTGDGTVTVAVTALTGLRSDPAGGPDATVPGVTPWSKAGVLVKQNLTPGSGYAAVTATAGHGVRMQHDYTHDLAGLPGAPSAGAPQWLRLVRTGAEVTGYDSPDGVRWTALGVARLTAPDAPVQVGLFVAAPAAIDTADGGGSAPALATGRFGRPSLDGAWAHQNGSWEGTQLGGSAGGSGSYPPGTSGDWTSDPDGGWTLTGAGDLAPVVGGPAGGPAFTVETSLIGTFVGLLVLAVLAVQFATAEHRRGLLGATLAATPRRGRVLAAKCTVVAAAAFTVGAAVATVSIPLGRMRAHATHFAVLTVPGAVELRAVLGTGLLLAATAVLALALGTALRRSATAITTVVATTVLPYLLAFGGLLPAGPAEWLLRLTPAAGFAVQQTLPRHAHVLSVYTPASGYFPLSPWTGLAVLLVWTALAVTTAAVLLRRRDA
ncbi:ABC transporter permease subunit [Streptomyces sp. TLI_171]|uniref:ABC transporter permease subunit n=1 Tax=Streptomyces sp. TLI_171 TaxID=1938859 RepID=UPI000C1A5DAF|nr:ABC transporter permease subunit [Streptomyces sp. TLI_171]RKE20076.1 ABC-type transport system involved in multi-copper enzyme maturation permease subunit [Streptomyces sp. TLI_171]